MRHGIARGASITAAVLAAAACSSGTSVSRATWVAVHEGCPPQSGLAYDVKTASLTGRTAVVRLSVKGDAGIVVSEALTYSAGHWGFVPDDFSLFENGSVKADIAAAKAEGFCGAS